MRKLIFIFVMCLMLGGSTSQSKTIDERKEKQSVIILRVKDDVGNILLIQEI